MKQQSSNMDYVDFDLLFVSEPRKNIQHGPVPTKTAHALTIHRGQAPLVLQAIVQVEWFNTLFVFVAGFYLYYYFLLSIQNTDALKSPCACAETF